MASVGNDAGGRKRILFYADDGSRMTIRLGKLSKGDASTIKYRVEQLLVSLITKVMDGDLSLWVVELHPELREKLERVGLLESSTPKKVTQLEAFIKGFLAGCADLKPSTMLIRN